MDHTVTLNKAECFRDVNYIGWTEVHNVCTGTVSAVPWGVGGWAVAVMVVLFGLMACTILYAMARL